MNASGRGGEGMTEVQANIEHWNIGCVMFAIVVDILAALVWLGGRLALGGMNS